MREKNFKTNVRGGGEFIGIFILAIIVELHNSDK
jgi:hypothetical protein